MSLTLSPLTSSLLGLLSNLPGEIESHVNLAELEKTVVAGLATGEGLPGVLTAVVTNASQIFNTALYSSKAVKLLSNTQKVATHPDAAPKLRPGASSPLPAAQPAAKPGANILAEPKKETL